MNKCVTILFLITGFFLIASILTPARAQSNNELHEKIQHLLTEQKLTGAVWTVIDSSGKINTGCAGLKNAKTMEEFQPTDKVQIGSITKTLLATAVLRLATEGKLRIDDPVNRYLPEVELINPWETEHPVTVRHLLDHTSGLSDLRLWHVFSTSSTPDTPLSAFYRGNPALLRVQAQPGAVFSYSNMGYTLVGLVIEAITKQPYESYLDEQLLKPLGMQNSTFTFVSQFGKHADTALAMGHLDKGQPHSAMANYLRPAMQFTTTAYDMGLLLSFLMSDGVIEGNPFIDKKYLSSIGKVSTTHAWQQGVPNGYALGTYARDRHGVVGIAHSGNIVGYHSFMCMFPEAGKAFFISHNMDRETADYEVFNDAIINHLQIPKQKVLMTASRSEGLTSWDGYYIPYITKVEPLGLLDYVGSYTKVTTTERGAVLSPFQNKSKSLTYTGNQLFIAEGKTTTSHAFYRSEQEEFLITDGISTLKKVSGLQILPVSLSFFVGMAALLFLFISGIYQCIKFKRRFLSKPIIWVFLAILVTIAAVAVLFTQPFMMMGDKTVGSFLLAIGSTLLLVLSLLSIYRYLNYKRLNLLQKLDFVWLVFLFQWTILLLLNGILPFILWR